MALLLVGYIIVNPKTDYVHAETGSADDASISLTIDNASTSMTVAPGDVGYIRKKIGLDAGEVKNYTLTITAPSTLSATSSDGTEIPNSTILNGANNMTGAEMQDNQNLNAWGYNYSRNLATDELMPSYQYKSFTGTAEILEKGDEAELTDSDRYLTLAAKFSNDATLGHYKADVILSLTTSPANVTYKITYDANGGAGAPQPTLCTTEGETGSNCTVAISTTTPTNYNDANSEFYGWSTDAKDHNNVIAAGQNITITDDTTLYAIYKDKRSLSDISRMQDMNWGICQNTTVNDQKNLTDSRDSASYTVKKLPDNRCWMLNNLRIIGQRTLTSSDSDVISNYSLPASALANNSYSITHAYIYQSTGYYTWEVATAGSGQNAKTDGAIASSSICPKGWKLPTGASKGEYNSMIKALDAATLRSYFPFTGAVNADKINDTTTKGHWWSSTAYNESSKYYMYVTSSKIVATYYDTSTYGFAVRCIARN